MKQRSATVREANPDTVILFGSRARGDSRPDSDVDLLIVEPEPFSPQGSRGQETARLYLAQNGDTVSGKKVVLIVKDDTGAPDVTKRIAQEMVINDKVHPTINQFTSDPECDLDYVPGAAIDQTVNVAITNTFGFGGHNTTLLFKKYTGD